jgi:hypothetical protein
MTGRFVACGQPVGNLLVPSREILPKDLTDRLRAYVGRIAALHVMLISVCAQCCCTFSRGRSFYASGPQLIITTMTHVRAHRYSIRFATPPNIKTLGRA